MRTMTAVEQPKRVMMNPNHRNQRRIEEDEKELEELMKQASGETEEQEEETSEETESVTEEVPSDTPEDSGTEEEELSSEEKTFKKRYGDLRRFVSQKEKEWEEKFDALKNDTPNGIAPPKSDEDLTAWAEKYPDVAGIVETIARKKAQEMFQQADSKFKQLDDLTYETKVAETTKKIREKHSDFDKLKASDAFHDWVEKQTKWIQDALYENEDDAQAVIRVIDLYKVDNGLTPQAKKVQAKDAASDVRVKGSPKVDVDNAGKAFKESEVSRMSDAEFEKNYDKIMESQQKGTFIYDVTKK